MAADTDIAEWLTGQGIEGADAIAEARLVLETAGLTRPGKQRITDAKLSKAESVLWAGITPICNDPSCRRSLRGTTPSRPIVTTTRARCSICGGSNTQRGVREMLDACGKAGLERVLLLGGSRAAHVELREALRGSSVELRLIDGVNDSPTKRDAIADLNSTQLLVIWASTQLPHKVSQSYTREKPPGLRQITVSRRGVEALCLEVARFARGGT